MSSIKICGLQQPEMVRSILHLPIDYIGFLFAKSKRQVTPEQASKMIEVLDEQRAAGLSHPLSVGVFVNPSQSELTSIMQEARLDVIQFHGQESPEHCQWVKDTFPGVQVWKVVSVVKGNQSHSDHTLAVTVKSESNTARHKDDEGAAGVPTAVELNHVDALLTPYKYVVDAILLDTFDPEYGGGSGKTFAWEAITAYQAWCSAVNLRLFVAGGLLPDNVGELLDTYAPDGVDVSSGVETDGMKDINKITRFVERVKHRDTSTG
ncbi:phosphoribosylanthranilate isomerase [Paenibacillus sp. 1_12]|uniref:phosphoribosylanthranilate isomerase n=1 Tax=Paenibacillus sp. 1_12 TaxID=1566278 RepID=UPI0008EF765A|nr:phosphoribosylanthranilate isomerase [Paenibacillus sp. 1_12]SFK91577.1 phosphoribosylanthranilate isomerase [Paenibacillus sp. 1_12]